MQKSSFLWREKGTIFLSKFFTSEKKSQIKKQKNKKPKQKTKLKSKTRDSKKKLNR